MKTGWGRAGQSLLSEATIRIHIGEAVRLEQPDRQPALGGFRLCPWRGSSTKTRRKSCESSGLIEGPVDPVDFQPPDPAPVDLASLSGTLYSLYGCCGAAIDEVGTNEPALRTIAVAARLD